MTAATRGLGAALGGLRRLAGLPVVDRLGLRPHIERAVFNATRTGFGTAAAAGRTFAKATSLARPARQAPTRPVPPMRSPGRRHTTGSPMARPRASSSPLMGTRTCGSSRTCGAPE